LADSGRRKESFHQKMQIAAWVFGWEIGNLVPINEPAKTAVAGACSGAAVALVSRHTAPFPETMADYRSSAPKSRLFNLTKLTCSHSIFFLCFKGLAGKSQNCDTVLDLATCFFASIVAGLGYRASLASFMGGPVVSFRPINIAQSVLSISLSNTILHKLEAEFKNDLTSFSQ
jgi:hypothetical protein